MTENYDRNNESDNNINISGFTTAQYMDSGSNWSQIILRIQMKIGVFFTVPANVV